VRLITNPGGILPEAAQKPKKNPVGVGETYGARREKHFAVFVTRVRRAGSAFGAGRVQKNQAD